MVRGDGDDNRKVLYARVLCVEEWSLCVFVCVCVQKVLSSRRKANITIVFSLSVVCDPLCLRAFANYRPRCTWKVYMHDCGPHYSADKQR